MQKARRFTCSTVCQSSPSNTSLRTRKKSRPPSADGDSGKAAAHSSRTFEAKSKHRSTKCNVNLLSSGMKTARKGVKPCRATRPNAGSLQSAVVLAPFYTLKKVFQNKLVDLYSNEKTKKMNQKSQMAKKKNMSFEYDIIELKPLETTVKKEGKSTRKPKSRSASYCQCNRIPDKEERQPPENSTKQQRRASSRKLFSPRTSSFSEQIRAKRRRLNTGVPPPVALKNEAALRQDFYTPQDHFPFTEANQSSSVMSSRSKCESWETYSNSPSCKEEHVHGSLAISTTSFDSYLEHFDKGSWDYSEPSRKCNSRAQQRRDQEPQSMDLLPQPTAKSLIVNVDRKNSDGEIVDFMDREPQSQVIQSGSSSQQWQPLRRQSKTKRKKPETESAAGYYLRSCSKENPVEGNRQECKSTCVISRTVQVEVGTQVEAISQEVQFPSSDDHLESSLSTCYQHVLREQTPEQSACEFKLRQKTQSPPREPSGDAEPPGEIPLPPPSAPSEQPQGQGQEAGLGLLGEHSDLPSLDLMGFPGPAHSQDKEYIFGPRNSTTELGESCEFSFGLKWVLSDDED